LQYSSAWLLALCAHPGILWPHADFLGCHFDVDIAQQGRDGLCHWRIRAAAALGLERHRDGLVVGSIFSYFMFMTLGAGPLPLVNFCVNGLFGLMIEFSPRCLQAAIACAGQITSRSPQNFASNAGTAVPAPTGLRPFRSCRGKSCKGQWFLCAQWLGCARRGRRGKGILSSPQAFTGQEGVFHAGACQLLQILVAEVVVQGGANVFVGDVDAADASSSVDSATARAPRGRGKRVLGSLNAQDGFVGAEINLTITCFSANSFSKAGHRPRTLRPRRGRCAGMAQFDGLANVEAQPLGRHQPGASSPACRLMKREVDGVQVIQHLHLQGVIAHGEEAIFGLYKVDAT